MIEKRECYLKIVDWDSQSKNRDSYRLSVELFGVDNKQVGRASINSVDEKIPLMGNVKLLGVVWCFDPTEDELFHISSAFPDLDHIRLCK
jgi:hypothetical protein